MTTKYTTSKKPATNFVINNYLIFQDENGSHLLIEGQKLVPPSKRITIYHTGIKIVRAKIIYKHKKGDIEFELGRINHIKSFGEIRLHTNNILYPGYYKLSLDYIGDLQEEKLRSPQ